MEKPKIEHGIMTINIPMDNWGPVMSVGYLIMAVDYVKEYFVMKSMAKAQTGIIRPQVIPSNGNGHEKEII